MMHSPTAVSTTRANPSWRSSSSCIPQCVLYILPNVARYTRGLGDLRKIHIAGSRKRSQQSLDFGTHFIKKHVCGCTHRLLRIVLGIGLTYTDPHTVSLASTSWTVSRSRSNPRSVCIMPITASIPTRIRCSGDNPASYMPWLARFASPESAPSFESAIIPSHIPTIRLTHCRYFLSSDESDDVTRSPATAPYALPSGIISPAGISVITDIRPFDPYLRLRGTARSGDVRQRTPRIKRNADSFLQHVFHRRRSCCRTTTPAQSVYPA